MKILVTGGAGYIGSTLTRMLLDKGYDVIILDRLFFSKKPIEDIEDRIKLVKDDIRWVSTQIFNGVDAIIDLASLSNDPSGELDKTKTYDINYLGRVRIAKLGKEYGVKRYILASSCSVYGFSNTVSTEESPINPLTTYSKAQALAEKDVLALSDKNFTVTALRQATVYGLSYKMRFDLVVNKIVQEYFTDKKAGIMGDGKHYRPLVEVRDTSAAFIKALEAEEELVNGQVFNVGSNEQNHTIFDLTKMVAEGIGVPFEYYYFGSPDTRSYNVNFDKIKKVLNFEPKYTVKKSVKELYDALVNGQVDPNDLRAYTVKWYKYLLEAEKLVSEVAAGNILL